MRPSRQRDAARPAELLPPGGEAAVLLQDLDAVVAAIGDEQPALLVHRDVVRRPELKDRKFLRVLPRNARGCGVFRVGERGFSP